MHRKTVSRSPEVEHKLFHVPSVGYRSAVLLVGNRSVLGSLSVARRSIAVGNRSVLGRLSDGNPWFPIGHGHSKLGARKYYLHSPQPESGRCGLLVILLEWKIRGNPEKYVGSLSEAPEKCA